MHVSRVVSLCAITVSASLGAGCDSGCRSNPSSSPAATPQLTAVSAPTASGGWGSVAASGGVFPVLPARGRGVRLSFTAPLGSMYRVTVVETSNGNNPIALVQNHGTPAPPESGYFQILSADSASPSNWLMYVRAPEALADPVNYTIRVVNLGGGGNVPESAAMDVALGPKPIFSVRVSVNGSGRVTSNPAGITCGSAPSGTALTACQFDFGQGVTLTLNPNSNTGSRFIEWTGNCSGSQVCTLTLTGAPMAATARFGPSTVPSAPMNCVAAPPLPGLQWIDRPNCATGVLDSHPGITLQCDAQGYFCCEPSTGANAPRCGGANMLESLPDCRHRAPRGLLRQPGGCYEPAP